MSIPFSEVVTHSAKKGRTSTVRPFFALCLCVRCWRLPTLDEDVLRIVLPANFVQPRLDGW